MAESEVARPELSALLTQAVPYAQRERLGTLILRTDPQYFRLTADESAEAVREALGLGARYGEELAQDQGTRDPYTLAERLGIQVEVSDETARYGNVLQYAEYRSRPLRIKLYRKSMGGSNRLLEDPRVSEILGLSDIAPAFLAHELFHHMDNLPLRLPAKRVRQVVTAKLGPWSLRSGLVTAPEIAAGSFGQALLRLPFHLKLLDLLAIYAESPTRAAEWVRVLTGADPGV